MIPGLTLEQLARGWISYWHWYLQGYNRPTMDFLHEYNKLIEKGHEVLDRIEDVHKRRVA